LMLDNVISGAVICRAFEDNRGTMLLATNQRLSGRTRHFNVKYHWFWEAVRDACSVVALVSSVPIVSPRIWSVT